MLLFICDLIFMCLFISPNLFHSSCVIKTKRKFFPKPSYSTIYFFKGMIFNFHFNNQEFFLFVLKFVYLNFVHFNFFYFVLIFFDFQEGICWSRLKKFFYSRPRVSSFKDILTILIYFVFSDFHILGCWLFYNLNYF